MKRCSLCSAKISEASLLCAAHWATVPPSLQGRVLALRKTVQRAANPSIQRMAAEEYRLAKQDAIAAANAIAVGRSREGVAS